MLHRLILALLLGCLLLTTACDRGDGIDAHPALWRVQDGDTAIWLLGTIHVLPDNVRWQTPAITHAIDASDTLVLEIAQGDPAANAAAFLKVARAPGLPPVLDRVPAETRATLADAAEQTDIPLKRLDAMKSWAAALTLSVSGAAHEGAKAENGVERTLDQRFAATGKPRLALETIDSQLALFDAQPESAQRQMLIQAADTAARRAADAQALTAWAAGDTAALALAVNGSLSDAPMLRKVLVTDRNQRWAGWIAARMAQPGTVLVAVGAGHLAGPDSVVAMLKARGLTVERVE